MSEDKNSGYGTRIEFKSGEKIRYTPEHQAMLDKDEEYQDWKKMVDKMFAMINEEEKKK